MSGALCNSGIAGEKEDSDLQRDNVAFENVRHPSEFERTEPTFVGQHERISSEAVRVVGPCKSFLEKCP